MELELLVYESLLVARWRSQLGCWLVITSLQMLGVDPHRVLHIVAVTVGRWTWIGGSMQTS
jgi:hypothetical protein